LQAATYQPTWRNDDNALSGDLVGRRRDHIGVSAPGSIIDGNGSVTHDRVLDIHNGSVIFSCHDRKWQYRQRRRVNNDVCYR
jgi:hypothetical protein